MAVNLKDPSTGEYRENRQKMPGCVPDSDWSGSASPASREPESPQKRPVRAMGAHTRLLRHVPADMGVAIVIVNHLRTVATRLHEILPRYKKMPVELITERLMIQPNRVFVIDRKS